MHPKMTQTGEEPKWTNLAENHYSDRNHIIVKVFLSQKGYPLATLYWEFNLLIISVN